MLRLGGPQALQAHVARHERRRGAPPLPRSPCPAARTPLRASPCPAPRPPGGACGRGAAPGGCAARRAGPRDHPQLCAAVRGCGGGGQPAGAAADALRAGGGHDGAVWAAQGAGHAGDQAGAGAQERRLCWWVPRRPQVAPLPPGCACFAAGACRAAPCSQLVRGKQC